MGGWFFVGGFAMGVAGRVFWFIGCLGFAAPLAQAAPLAAPASSDTARVIEAQYPGYGVPVGPGYGQEWDGRREHCLRLRDRLREVRYRMERGPYWERDRLEGRFHELRERLRHECWGHWREE
jgi:hypothetical protein